MKERTVIIKGKPFCYQDEIDDITNENNTPISEDDARELLTITSDLFGKIGLKFSLAFGTLLGAIRDNSIIKGDEDVDVFIWNEDLLLDNLQFLQDNNYRLCRFVPGRIYSFRVNDRSYIDVYIKRSLEPSIWSIYCTCLYDKAVPKKYFLSYKEIEFLGGRYLVPNQPEKLLKFYYGTNWRVPTRSHNFTYEVSSRVLWKAFKANFFSLIRFAIHFK